MTLDNNEWVPPRASRPRLRRPDSIRNCYEAADWCRSLSGRAAEGGRLCECLRTNVNFGWSAPPQGRLKSSASPITDTYLRPECLPFWAMVLQRATARLGCVRRVILRPRHSDRTAAEAAIGPSRAAAENSAFAQLERVVGNRVMTALLQRQLDLTTRSLLSPGQSARAVSFYRRRPDLYTPDVITKIQHAVKSPETRAPDSEMAEGVARFQNVSVLKVDGMAGPRTLPRLFESGLATESSRGEFVGVAKEVKGSWAVLGTAEARAAKLFEGVKVLLDDQKVPTPAHEVGDLGKVAGRFEWKFWKITFDRVALSPNNVDDEAVREIASTVYHEARHAEQHHKMARMRAAKGRSAEQIHAEMKIPIEIAKDAFNNPLHEGIEFATAAQQYDSIYGSGRAHFEKAEAGAPSNVELKEARAAVKTSPTLANKARLARLEAAHRAYHDLPTEHDASATEIDFGASWDEASIGP
jgi:hypothetical protein